MEHDIELIHRFHTTLAARDVDSILAMATEDIEVGGARGRGSGAEFLLEWVRFARISLTPRRWFRDVTFSREGRHGMPGEFASTLVVEEDALWHGATGREMGRMTFVTVYRVANDKLAGIARYATLGEAIVSAGLTPDHEVPFR